MVSQKNVHSCFLQFCQHLFILIVKDGGVLKKSGNLLMIGTRILKIDSEIKHPFLVFTILSASIHPNCKSWGNFEKFRKFAPILFAESPESQSKKF